MNISSLDRACSQNIIIIFFPTTKKKKMFLDNKGYNLYDIKLQ